MLLHLPIAILVTLSPIAVSSSVPQFDIARECRFEGGSTATFERCLQDETVALAQLTTEWAQFAITDQKTCMIGATTGGFASYVDLLTCLEMARDAKKTEDNPRGSQKTDSMRLRSTGVTVGVGRDPIAPPQ